MKHILIVDDDIHINKMLDEVLVHERYMVSHAYSGTEALLFLADTKPDLILLDLMLPGLSGEELLPQISDIPIIVMSAKVDVEDKVSLLLGGAVDYVTKPFDTKELLARITVALRVKTLIKQNIRIWRYYIGYIYLWSVHRGQKSKTDENGICYFEIVNTKSEASYCKVISFRKN